MLTFIRLLKLNKVLKHNFLLNLDESLKEILQDFLFFIFDEQVSQQLGY